MVPNSTHDTVEFSVPWTHRLARVLAIPLLPLVLPGLLTPLIFALIDDDPYENRARWPALAALTALIGLVLVTQARSKTVVTRAGITCSEVGRPWRLLRRTFVPWHDIAAIKAHRGAAGVLPVLHLNDGGVVWVRMPAGRRGRGISEKLTQLQQRHLEATGLDPAQVAAGRKVPVPPMRRRALVAGLSAVVIAADLAVVIALFSGLFTGPPDVLNCRLIPAEVTQRIIPGSVPAGTDSSGATRPGEGCRWQRPNDQTQRNVAVLSLSAVSYAGDYARTSHKEDRRVDRAKHVIHPVPKSDGYFWSALDSGTVKATARASTGGYKVEVELRSSGYGLTRAAAEQQVSEAIRAAVANLDGSRS
ncbi:hypothetical protein [Actinomadura sp. HBU206391]|uniref:hypothetical protein n=1 Tax=Actinomadura sp. HBU206391 TaxID=2731692 RepID=UPI001650A0C0|nr:hypothetical protein [Actinomadura sp. HBU206391]MBC6456625.1 hypothetical protein [Actinomadura sp. HBU206391]